MMGTEPDFEGIKQSLDVALINPDIPVWIVVKPSEEVYLIAYLIKLFFEWNTRIRKVHIHNDGLHMFKPAYSDTLHQKDVVILRERSCKSFEDTAKVIYQKWGAIIAYEGVLILLRPYSPQKYDILSSHWLTKKREDIKVVYWTSR